MRRTWTALPATLGMILFLSACAKAPAKHYEMKGEVVSTDARAKMILVSGEEIPGLMPAMTMSYAVADEKEIENLGAGDKIRADLVVQEGRSRLEKIVLVKKADKEPPAAAPVKGETPKDGTANKHPHPMP